MRVSEGSAMYGAYCAVFFDLFGTLVDERGRAFTRAADILCALPPPNWGIVTSCSRRLAELLLSEAGLPLPAIMICDDDVTASKPSPEPYATAVQRIGVDPAKCLAVEDSVQGVQSALSAGLDVVAIRRGRAVQFPIRAHVVDDLARLAFSEDSEGLLRVSECHVRGLGR